MPLRAQTEPAPYRKDTSSRCGHLAPPLNLLDPTSTAPPPHSPRAGTAPPLRKPLRVCAPHRTHGLPSPPPPAAQPPAPTPAGCCGAEPPVPSAPLRSVPLLPPRSAPPGPAASRPAAPRCGKWRRGRRPVGAPGWGWGGGGGPCEAVGGQAAPALPSPGGTGRPAGELRGSRAFRGFVVSPVWGTKFGNKGRVSPPNPGKEGELRRGNATACSVESRFLPPALPAQLLVMLGGDGTGALGRAPARTAGLQP